MSKFFSQEKYRVFRSTLKYAQLYEAATGEKADLDMAYDTFFSAEALIEADFVASNTGIESEEWTLGRPAKNPITAATAKKAQEGLTDAALAGETGGDVHDPGDRRTSSPRPKLAHNVQHMRWTEENGFEVTSDRLKDFDPNDPVQNHFVLDTAFMERVRREAEADPNVLTARQMDDDNITVGRGRTWGQAKAEARKLYGDGTAEYRAWYAQAVPVAVVYAKGGVETALSMLHTKEWYNERNVKTTDGRNIAQGIHYIHQIREHLAANGGSLPIRLAPDPGDRPVQLHRAQSAPLTLNRANPESRIAMVRYSKNGNVEVVEAKAGNGTGTKPFTGRLRNSEEGLQKLARDGAIVHANYIGDAADGTPTYMLFPVMDTSPVAPQANLRADLDPQLFHTIREAVLAATLLNNAGRQDIVDHFAKRYGMTVEQARSVSRRVERETGIRLEDNLRAFVGMFTKTNHGGGLTSVLGDANRPDGITYVNGNRDGSIEFSLKGNRKGRGADGKTAVDRKYTLGNGYRGALSSLDAALEALVGDGGWLHKVKASVDMSHTNNGTSLTLVNADGSLDTRPYEGHFKDRLLTNIISHGITTYDGGTKWITDVHPMYHYDLLDADGSPILLTEPGDGPNGARPEGQGQSQSQTQGQTRGQAQTQGQSQGQTQSQTQGPAPAVAQQQAGTEQRQSGTDQQQDSGGLTDSDYAEIFGDGPLPGTESAGTDAATTTVEDSGVQDLARAVRDTGLLDDVEKDIVLSLLETGMGRGMGTGLGSRHQVTEAERQAMDSAGTNLVEGVAPERQRAVVRYLMHAIVGGIDFGRGVSGGELMDLIRKSPDAHLLPQAGALRGIMEKLEGQPGLEGAVAALADAIGTLELLHRDGEKLAGRDGALVREFEALFHMQMEDGDSASPTEGDRDAGGEVYGKSFMEKDIRLEFSREMVLSLFGMAVADTGTGRAKRGMLGLPQHHSPSTVLNRLYDITTAIPSSWPMLLHTLDSMHRETGQSLYAELRKKLEALPEHLRNEAMHRLIAKKLTLYKVLERPATEEGKGDGGSVRVTAHTITVLDENSGKALITLRRHMEQEYLHAAISTHNANGDRILNREHAGNIIDAIDRLSARDALYRSLLAAVDRGSKRRAALAEMPDAERQAEHAKMLAWYAENAGAHQKLEGEIAELEARIGRIFGENGARERTWARAASRRAESGLAAWEREVKGLLRERDSRRKRANVLLGHLVANEAARGEDVSGSLGAWNVGTEDLRTVLAALGMGSLHDNTLRYWRNKGGHFGSSGLFGVLRKGLERLEGTGGEVLLGERANHLLKNASGAMRSLLDIEVMLNRDFVGNAVHVNGKTVQSLMNNTALYDINQRLSGSEGLVDAYLSLPYSARNYLLRMLKGDKNLRDLFGDIGVSSPEALKSGDNEAYGDTEFDKIPEKDNLIAVLGLFTNRMGRDLSNATPFAGDPRYGGLRFRMAQMTVPTLSDKGRMVYLRVPVLELDGRRVAFEGEGIVLEDGVLEFMAEQVFDNELDRILQSYQQDTGISGYDLSAKLFHALPSLNAIEVEVGGGEDVHPRLPQAHGAGPGDRQCRQGGHAGGRQAEDSGVRERGTGGQALGGRHARPAGGPRHVRGRAHGGGDVPERRNGGNAHHDRDRSGAHLPHRHGLHRGQAREDAEGEPADDAGGVRAEHAAERRFDPADLPRGPGLLLEGQVRAGHEGREDRCGGDGPAGGVRQAGPGGGQRGAEACRLADRPGHEAGGLGEPEQRLRAGVRAPCPERCGEHVLQHEGTAGDAVRRLRGEEAEGMGAP